MNNNQIFIHVSPISSNAKTGPIPVTTTSKNTCPASCALKGNGCYAEVGHVGLHWRKVSTGARGMPFEDALDAIRALPARQLVRHNQAGDLPGSNDILNKYQNIALADALTAKRKRPFSYTHYPVTGDSPTAETNRGIIKAINKKGFVVNLSANNLDQADAMLALGIAPVVTVLPIDAPKLQVTPQGNKVITCPATYNDNVTCATCALCAIPATLKGGKTRAIIGFPAHGTSKRKAQAVFMMQQVG